MIRSTLLLSLAGALAVLTPLAGRDAPPAAQERAADRPNIVFAIADDWSHPHASAYEDPTVRTPTFDQIAREGVLFTHAFVTAPSCTPSRASILTGLYPHQLAEGGNLWGFLPARFAVYPDRLEAAGYHVGYTGKGWGPGRPEAGGRDRNPAGPRYDSFDAFLAARPRGAPYAFWFGSSDPHRPYDGASGLSTGLDPSTVRVPASLPDTPVVRADLIEYYAEVQRFDRDVGALLARIEASGEGDRTLVVVTSDNGMPFPRAKATVYDGGTRVPLAVRWPARVAGGRTAETFVSLHDLAPTFLEAAGVEAPGGLTGRSLLPLLEGRSPGHRDEAFVERERHANVRRGDLSYPVRAIRTREFLYIRNLRPDRWPAGDPETYFSVGPYGDIDGGPTKSELLAHGDRPQLMRPFLRATAKRPAEELYDLSSDPHQLTNVADVARYASRRDALRQRLEAWMLETGDPRATDDDDRWDGYPYYGGRAQGR